MTEIEKGDVFVDQDGKQPVQVQSVGRFGEYVTVTDPTCHHPQDARSGTWEMEVSLIEDGLECGDTKRASLDVVTED